MELKIPALNVGPCSGLLQCVIHAYRISKSDLLVVWREIIPRKLAIKLSMTTVVVLKNSVVLMLKSERQSKIQFAIVIKPLFRPLLPPFYHVY